MFKSDLELSIVILRCQRQLGKASSKVSRIVARKHEGLFSVVDPDPGSGAFLTPGSGEGFFRIPDLGSRISKPYFWELNENFLHKKFHNFLKIGQNFFLQQFKHKIIFSFVKFVATKQGMTTIYFFTPLCCCCFWIRDPGWVKIRIRDKHPGSASLGPFCMAFYVNYRTDIFQLNKILQTWIYRRCSQKWARRFGPALAWAAVLAAVAVPAVPFAPTRSRETGHPWSWRIRWFSGSDKSG